jgi:hypothetical protein
MQRQPHEWQHYALSPSPRRSGMSPPNRIAQPLSGCLNSDSLATQRMSHGKNDSKNGSACEFVVGDDDVGLGVDVRRTFALDVELTQRRKSRRGSAQTAQPAAGSALRRISTVAEGGQRHDRDERSVRTHEVGLEAGAFISWLTRRGSRTGRSDLVRFATACEREEQYESGDSHQRTVEETLARTSNAQATPRTKPVLPGALNEFGIAARVDGEALRFVVGVRTAWSNPNEIVSKLLAIAPAEILAGKGPASPPRSRPRARRSRTILNPATPAS